MSLEIKVVERAFVDDFESDLQELLSDGWDLYGNMNISVEPREEWNGTKIYFKRYTQILTRLKTKA